MSARTRWWVDAAIVGLVAGTIAINLTNGFYIEPFGLRVSARRPDRPFVLALLLAWLRWRVWRSPDFLGMPSAQYARWRDRVFRPEADPPVAGRRPSGSLVAAAFGLLACGALLMRRQLAAMDSVPDLGDPLFSIWRMGWVYQQLLGDPRPLFDANILHPTPLTLTLSDAILLPSLVVAAPLFATGLHPVLVYNGLFLAAFVASGLAAYMLLARLTGSTAGAFLGAVFYAFHPFRFEHYSHLELQMTVWMPLALLALVRLVDTGRLRYALAAGLLAALQLYSSMYYGVYFPLYAAVVILAYAALRGAAWQRLWRPTLAGAGLALVMAVPLAVPYVRAQSIKGDRDEAAVRFYSADVSDYFRAHPRSTVWSGLLLGGHRPERALFPGATAPVLSMVALAAPVGPVRLAALVGLVAGYDLSRGLKGVAYPTLYRWLSPIRGLRVPARVSMVFAISLAILAAYGAQRVLDRLQGAWARRTAWAGMAALLLVDLHPTLELVPVWREPPTMYRELANRPDVVLAEFPIALRDPRITPEVPYMYFSFWHWRQMVNGYSGFELESHLAWVSAMRTFPDEASIAALRAHGVTHVTVNCLLSGDGPSCEALLREIDGRPDFERVRSETWEGRPARLYRLRPAAGTTQSPRP